MSDDTMQTFLAGEAMTSPRGLPVRVSAANTVVLCDGGADAEDAIGVVAQDTDVASGGQVTVAVIGVPRLYKAGATITPGTHQWLVTETATGRVKPGASGEEACALFLGKQAAADDDLCYAIPFRHTIP